MEIERLTPADAGCIFDSHRGHYIVPAIIGFAIGCGYQADPFICYAIARYSDDSHASDYPTEALIEESDAATAWLNENIAPEGYYIDWNDGDFGMYADEDSFIPCDKCQTMLGKDQGNDDNVVECPTCHNLQTVEDNVVMIYPDDPMNQV